MNLTKTGIVLLVDYLLEFIKREGDWSHGEEMNLIWHKLKNTLKDINNSTSKQLLKKMNDIEWEYNKNIEYGQKEQHARFPINLK